MKKIYIVSVAFFVLAACISVGALAVIKDRNTVYSEGLVAYMDVDDLVTTADVIVKGTIEKSLPSEWSNPGFKRGDGIRNILQTDIVITVDEVFKGKPYDEKEIAVRVDYGETLTSKTVSEGYPEFARGEEVILFLSLDDSDVKTDENYYVLTGMRQGKYYLDKASGSGGTYISASGRSGETIDISALKEMVSSAAGK